jgi:hypothetical protein
VAAEPPPAVHPADIFPAPPGFLAEQTGTDRWKFNGPGSPGAAAIFFRTSCVQLFDWTPVDETRAEDGSWMLRYRRTDARLSVHVGESDDRLEILITLDRAPATSSRSETTPER